MDVKKKANLTRHPLPAAHYSHVRHEVRRRGRRRALLACDGQILQKQDKAGDLCEADTQLTI
jgi:hypothetical protein